VMHILDRSHVKYKLQLDNSYIVDSQSAKKSISPESKAGVITLKSKETMLNRVTQASRSQSRRKSNRNNVSTLREIKTEKKGDGDNNFLPDIKDYHRIIERGLDRMNGLKN